MKNFRGLKEVKQKSLGNPDLDHYMLILFFYDKHVTSYKYCINKLEKLTAHYNRKNYSLKK